ncbi:MAG: putative efflux protein [Herbinix sp.]|jgi:threonine/homoserine/homoserine lactone efflux protein|nr:putative efflux protein [Herbinix sp.]
MILKGLRFGMLLQIAIGPMCLFVFNTSTTNGFFMGLSLVLAIALVDGLYIVLSGIGIAAIINREKVKVMIKVFGCIVLVIYGISILAGVFGYSLLPSMELFTDVTGKSFFMQGVLLTASNPLTIIFWSGVFSTQMLENKLVKHQVFFFGLGCVLSTLLFLTAIALLGSIVSTFIPNILIQILNAFVGIVLIISGIKLAVRNSEKSS